MRRSDLVGIVILLGSACQGGGAGSSGGPVTTIDSTADSVFVRVGGPVPESAVRHLVEELRIAPGAEDTSLFTQISEFDVDPAGRMWVFDTPTRSILLFGADGKLIKRIGRQGGGPGEFQWNTGMVVLGDTGLALWDSQNGRISFFSASGEFRTSWPVSTGFSASDGLVTDRSGALLFKQVVAPLKEGELHGRVGLVRFGAGGAPMDSLAPPQLPVEEASYVAERRSGDGFSRSSTGSRFGPRYFWSWHPDGYFVAANGATYEIVLARRTDEPIAIRRESSRIAIAQEEREEEQTRITYSMRRTDPGWSWKGPDIPTVKAPLSDLFVARDGRIWAQVPVASERIPDAELAVPRDPKQPVAHFRTPLVYEVFTADGRFLSRVNFPPRSRLMEADGNAVWARLLVEEDLPAVVRFRIEPGLDR